MQIYVIYLQQRNGWWLWRSQNWKIFQEMSLQIEMTDVGKNRGRIYYFLSHFQLNSNVWILTLPSILSDQNVSWLMNSTVDLMKPSFFLELEKFLSKLAAQFWNDLLENKPNMKTDKRSSNTLRYLSMMDIRVTPLIWLEEDTSHVEQKHTFFHCNPRYGTQQKKFFQSPIIYSETTTIN